METLTQNVPGLNAAYTKLREFSRSDELRELALARQKAERDRIAGINFAKNEGREEGLAEGCLKGYAEACKSELFQILKIKFPQQLTPDLELAISRITDAQQLDVLFTEALMTDDIQNVAKLL